MDGNESKLVDLSLTFLVKSTGQEWEVLCLELDIASCGGSEEEAIDSLKGLIELYVSDCVEENELPVPLRPVTREAIMEFLQPPHENSDMSLASRRESFPVRYAYS